jgi:hypothetical protein
MDPIQQKPLSFFNKKLGSLEGPVYRFLSARAYRDHLIQELKRTNKTLKDLKEDSQLMTIIGQIDRLQEKRDEAELEEEESSSEDEEVPPKKRPKTGDSKARLTLRMAEKEESKKSVSRDKNAIQPKK